jgi:hypothetical protein
MSTDIDRLTSQLDTLVKRIDAEIDKRTQHFSFSHDDGNGDGDGEVDASDPTADDGYDNPGDDGDDGYDDEDVEDEFDKATIDAAAIRNDPSNRPGDLPTSSHTSSSNARHKFEAMVERISNDKGIPKSEAMARARQQYPELYRNYVGSADYLKAAPGSFEALVSEQMAKGCSTYEQAAQRVVQQHGYRAFDSRDMSKREAVSVVAESELMSKANDIWRDDPTLTRTDALRAARQDHPALYKRMNR